MHSRLALAGLLLVGAAACKPDRPERGCIQVDGRGHYRDVADAIELADPGATLTLCDTAIVESVSVDKTVTIEGLGAGESLWLPPEGEVAATIEDGAELTIIGVGLTTTGDTFTVESGGALILEDVLISQPGGWGVQATDGTVVLDGSIVEGAALGAVHATGPAATVTLNGAQLSSNIGWGVLGEAGATLTVDDSFLLGTFVSDDTASQFDGFAIGLKSGSTATITRGTADGNILGVLYGEGGSTAVIDGLDASGNYFAVWGETLDLTIRNTTIADSLQYDILAIAGSVVTLENVDLTVDPASADNSYEDLSNTLMGHYGVLMQTGKGLYITDSDISGHNGGALFVIGAVSEDVPVEITRTTMDDNASQAALYQWAQVTMTDVDVTNTRNNDAGCIEDGIYYCNWGIAAFAASVDWTGGDLTNSGGIGALVQEDSATFTNVTMADNLAASVWGENAAVRIEGGSVAGDGEFGIYSYNTVLDVVDVAFADRDFTYVLEQGTGLPEYHYADRATDVFAYLSTVNVAGSTFTNGDKAIYVESSEATVTDSTFSGYAGIAVQLLLSTLDADGLTFTGMAPRALYCYGSGSTMSVSDTTITDTKNATGTIETWIDGVLQQPVSTYVVTGPVVQGSVCGVDLDHVTIDGSDNTALDFSDGDVELSDVVVRDTARLGNTSTSPTVWARYTTRSPVVFAAGLTVTGVHFGDAMTVQGRTADTEALVSLQDVRIGVDVNGMSGVAGEGLNLVTLGCPDPTCSVGVSGLEIASTGSHALYAQGSWVDVQGAGDIVTDGSITNAGGDAVNARSWVSLGGTGTGDEVVRAGLVDLHDLTITSPTQAGVRVQGSSYGLDHVIVSDPGTEGIDIAPWTETGLSGPEDDVRIEPDGLFDTVSVTDSGASGVALTGGQHSVGALSVTGATGWGLECALDPAEDVPVIDACTISTLEGDLGPLQGCDPCAP